MIVHYLIVKSYRILIPHELGLACDKYMINEK